MRYFLPIAVVSLVMISACREKTVNATTFVVKGTGTSVYPIEKLFELDGCNVYRFNDGASVNMFSVCPRIACPVPACTPTPTPTPEPKGGHRKLQGEEDSEK